MELDWTTFFLEILNFLVLVWILKHFFYRPVLAAINRRRSYIEETLANSTKIQEEALTLKAANETERAAWDKERDALHIKLTEEINAKREHMMAELTEEAEQIREKNRALDDKRQQEWQRATEERALTQATQFTATLLSRLASPELEAKLYALLIEDLQELTPAEASSLLSTSKLSDLLIKVESAYPLSQLHRTELSELLTELIGQTLPVNFSENPTLLCGLQVSIGPWILHANLRDELALFKDSRHSAS
ncbi:F0F1 ATP synthase subunit delta [Sulfurirhabdus autotrophica]|uniref:ATP synthase subunit b n=1 Tax=Sulfurirhabdus autotrophica TaxID=1706046 RepID=A0A4R3YCT6_9PROT|nr:F0F1 ATP synthase subunit delta [Sulfurirhabdus autotrophica]TCV90275.1 F-type H+-transporting ATPase subunit b [Sulfurirhabdus autotrophica]